MTTLAQGKRRLRDLLPAARAQARRYPDFASAKSEIGRATSAHVTEDNIEAVIIEPAPLGGWYCDVIFKHVPPGVPNAMGTPVEKPWPTREAAEASALPILTAVLVLAAKNAAGAFPDRNPAFLLCDHSIRLYGDVLEKVGEIEGYVDSNAAADRIKDFLSIACPEGFTGQVFNAWPADIQARLLAILHVAAVSGLYRYPPRMPGKPQEDTVHA